MCGLTEEKLLRLWPRHQQLRYPTCFRVVPSCPNFSQLQKHVRLLLFLVVVLGVVVVVSVLSSQLTLDYILPPRLELLLSLLPAIIIITSKSKNIFFTFKLANVYYSHCCDPPASEHIYLVMYTENYMCKLMSQAPGGLAKRVWKENAAECWEKFLKYWWCCSLS